MKLHLSIKTTLQLLLILSISTLLASCTKEVEKEAPYDPMTFGALIGVNYTNEGVQRFSVDRSVGSSTGRYGVSGTVCCTRYPKIWSPDLKVTVEWERTDCDKEWDVCVREMAKLGKEPYKIIKKTVPIEKYTVTGDVFVTFLPKDEVRVYVSEAGPGRLFPLGMPKNPNKTKENTR